MKIRVAAISDIHVGRSSYVHYKDMFTQIGKQADVLVMCGDLTHNGFPHEAKRLVEELADCPIPKLAILGNHDYHQNKQNEIKEVLHNGNVCMLEDEAFELHGVGFTGVKGFGGGFGSHTLGMFGEESMKDFAREAIAEAEALEVHLEELDHQKVEKKVVIMHYSPIAETLKGEALEIYPFLGTSRLEEVVDRFNVTTVFHGHAHFGSHQGYTIKKIPVYNVALPLMEKISKTQPYKIIEI